MSTEGPIRSKFVSPRKSGRANEVTYVGDKNFSTCVKNEFKLPAQNTVPLKKDLRKKRKKNLDCGVGSWKNIVH